MNFDRAIKLSIKILTEKRRQYAPEHKIYLVIGDENLKNESEKYLELDEAIKILKKPRQTTF